MALVPMPTSPGIAEVTWSFSRPTQVNRSEFTSRRRVTLLPAASRCSANVKIVTILGEAGVRPWRAFFELLDGQAGQFRLVAVENAQITGVSITVDGANQVGRQLATAGWGAAGTKLKAGCFATVADQLLRLTADVTAEANGKALLSFRTPLRAAPAAGAAVVVDRPYALMSMATDVDKAIVGRGQQYGVEFDCEESF